MPLSPTAQRSKQPPEFTVTGNSPSCVKNSPLTLSGLLSSENGEMAKKIINRALAPKEPDVVMSWQTKAAQIYLDVNSIRNITDLHSRVRIINKLPGFLQHDSLIQSISNKLKSSSTNLLPLKAIQCNLNVDHPNDLLELEMMAVNHESILAQIKAGVSCDTVLTALGIHRNQAGLALEMMAINLESTLARIKAGASCYTVLTALEIYTQ